MAKDIAFMGAVFPDVPSIRLPQQGGGLVSFDDTTDATATADKILESYTAYVNGQKLVGTASGGGIIVPKTITLNGEYDAQDEDVGGYSPVLVNVDLKHLVSFDPIVVTLAETAFNGWTPSTTAKAILATQTVGTFIAENIADHDYYVRHRVYIHLVYVDGTSTAKGMFQFSCGENWNCLTRKASTASNLNSGTKNQNGNESVSNTFLSKYYNSGWTAIYSSSNGIYPSNTAQTLSSTSASSPTVTVKTPVINAKCNSTYFSTAMAGKVDQDASTIKFVSDVYRADAGYKRSLVNESLMDMWRNGL